MQQQRNTLSTESRMKTKYVGYRSDLCHWVERRRYITAFESLAVEGKAAVNRDCELAIDGVVRNDVSCKKLSLA
jgi:hypothetical protein